MATWRRLPIVVLALLPAACGRLLPANNQTVDPGRLQAGAYRLDPDHASLLWKVNHLGFSTYVGRFNRVDGSLDFDPARPALSKLSIAVDTTSVDSRNPALDEALRGADWLDAATYPQALFTSRTVEPTGERTARVTGDLVLRGVTRPLTLDVTFNGGADNLLTGTYTLGFAARGIIERSEFGISTLVPAIGDEVTLEIDVEFQAR